jgi:hypothetical protein
MRGLGGEGGTRGGQGGEAGFEQLVHAVNVGHEECKLLGK